MASEEVTQVLADLTRGDTGSAARLLPLVYEELRRLADQYLRDERPDHTLQGTALVHEAFLRLVDQKDAKWQNRAHFYRVAAMAMRRILVNHARDRQRIKRGGGRRKFSLDDIDTQAEAQSPDLIALDEALTKLSLLDHRKAQLVELRYFAGFTIEESARILEISPAQLKREWTLAKTWLLRELRRGGECER
ncbi:MAG: sigma-70 family RNA polymerase sigma factor [Phycisphaerae bacterium]